MSSSTTGLPDMTGSVYSKTQVRGRIQVDEGVGGRYSPSWPLPLFLYPADF